MIFVLRAMLRHWRVMLLFAILGVLVAVVYIQYAPRVYKAVAVLEMSVRRPRVINNDAVFESMDSGRDTDAIFNTRFEKFKSPAMERLAVREFFKRYPESRSEDNPAGINQYTLPPIIREVRWRKDSDANIVRVSYDSTYPRFAANLLNVLTDCAGILMQEENQAQSDEAVKWLISQIEEQRKSLDDFEGELFRIRKEVQLDTMQQRKTALSQAIVSVSEQRESLISKLGERKTIYDFVSGLRDVNPALEVLPSGLPKEDQLNELIRGWRSAHDEFQQVAVRYTSSHPDYRLAQQKESRAKARLEEFIEHSVQAVKTEVELLEQQIKQMDERIQSMKKESMELEHNLAVGLQRIQGLERKRDAADNSFQNMLRRKEEARAAADENMAYAKVIRSAYVPKGPIKPKKPQVLILCIMISGLIGMGCVVVVEFWTDTIASVNDLKKLQLYILGIFPSEKNVDSRGELATIGLRDKFNAIVETFAGINALLSSDRYMNHSKEILITSVMPGEGKTITACNLAISSALNGNRTLLVEGDMRRPQLINIFSIDETHPSLLEWLVDDNSELHHEDLVSSNVISNMDVIPSKPLTDINPAELLGRNRLAELLSWARQNYDRIIIDSPPLGPVGDAQVLANLADGIIIVSRIGKTRRRLLRLALARFSEIDAHVLGCIANDVPNSLVGMFNGAESYGAGYGYNSYKGYGRD